MCEEVRGHGCRGRSSMGVRVEYEMALKMKADCSKLLHSIEL